MALTWLGWLVVISNGNPAQIFRSLFSSFYLALTLASLATLAAGIAILRQRARALCVGVCAIGLAAMLLFYQGSGRVVPELGGAFVFGLGLLFLLTPRPRIPIRNPPASPDGANWRRWLLASLQGEGVRPLRDRFQLGVVAVLIVLAISIPAAIVVVMARHTGGAILALIPAVLAVLAMRALRGTWITKWVHVASARSAENELQSPGSRRPVLYLRSFALDQVPDAEQKVMRQLRHLGPVIAIGRPGEAIPPLGAARFYVDHTHWQAKVADIVKVAQLVVWATGTTEGLRWELNHLRQNLAPEKLVLWAHPHVLGLTGARAEAEWSRFLTMLGGIFPVPLPTELGDTRFITFDKDWLPHMLIVRGGDIHHEAAKFLLSRTEKPGAVQRRRMVRYALIGLFVVTMLLMLRGLFR